MKNMKRQKYVTLNDKLSRSVGVQYAIGEWWRNNSRKNEEMKVTVISPQNIFEKKLIPK